VFQRKEIPVAACERAIEQQHRRVPDRTTHRHAIAVRGGRQDDPRRPVLQQGIEHGLLARGVLARAAQQRDVTLCAQRFVHARGELREEGVRQIVDDQRHARRRPPPQVRRGAVVHITLALEFGLHARTRADVDQGTAAQYQRDRGARDIAGAGDVVDGDGFLARHCDDSGAAHAAGGRSSGAVPHWPGASPSAKRNVPPARTRSQSSHTRGEGAPSNDTPWMYCTASRFAPGASMRNVRPPPRSSAMRSKRGGCNNSRPVPGIAGYNPIVLNRYHADIVPRSSLPVTPLGALVNSDCAARRTTAVFAGCPISVYIHGAWRSGSLFGLYRYWL